MSWLLLLRSRAVRYLAVAGGILLAIITFGASQRRAGRKEAETKAMRRRAVATQKANEVQDDVQGMDDARVRDALSEWMRDDKHGD